MSLGLRGLEFAFVRPLIIEGLEEYLHGQYKDFRVKEMGTECAFALYVGN